jgi:TolA-binding protein
MNDWPRLRHQGSALERELLNSALEDKPNASSRQRTMVALGLGAALATAATAVQGAGVVGALGSGAGAAASPLTTASKVTALAIAKWLGGGVVAGAVTVGAIQEVTLPKEPTPVAASAARAAPKAIPAETRRAGMPRVTPSAEATALRALAPPSGAPSSAFEDLPRSLVASEVGALDRARAALAAGKPKQALTLLDRYHRKFPEGVLRPEAELVRVQALAKLGDLNAVAVGARSFLDEHPSSPHAPKVRSLLDQAEAAAPVTPSTPARSPSVARFPEGE